MFLDMRSVSSDLGHPILITSDCGLPVSSQAATIA